MKTKEGELVHEVINRKGVESDRFGPRARNALTLHHATQRTEAHGDAHDLQLIIRLLLTHLLSWTLSIEAAAGGGRAFGLGQRSGAGSGSRGQPYDGGQHVHWHDPRLGGN